ncbi:MAG: glycosyltransferase family 39 protein [Elusimicrobia bacterium]|nr:glycosyltransferase family 39 protein [Elusimicrobiota bacterium]
MIRAMIRELLPAALLAAALSSPFWGLGHPLVEVDDARYAAVPREMLASGAWLTPTLNGMEYVEKPPLWYWLAKGSYLLFGVSEGAARLPLALLSVCGLMITAWLGSWVFERGLGAKAAAMLASSALYFFLSHYITLDLALTVFLWGCCALLLRCLAKPEQAYWASPLAWFLAALAFLTKGLVALLLPLMWLAAIACFIPSWRPRLRAALNPCGLLIIAAVIVPWLWSMEDRHPGFLRFFFREQHVERYLTAKYNRSSPWYFFLLVLPAAVLPWAGAGIAGVAQALRRQGREPEKALALWALTVTAFFSLSQSKLISYILPAIPALCLLAAKGDEKPVFPGGNFLSLLLAGLLLAGGALAWPWRHSLDGLPSIVFQIGAASAALYASALIIQSLGKPRHWPWSAALALAAGGLALSAARPAQAWLGARPLALALAQRMQPADQLLFYGTYLHSLGFYLGRPADRIIYWSGELHYAERNPRHARRFGDDDEIRQLRREGGRAFLVCRAFEASYLQGLLGHGTRVELFGPWALLEFSGDKPGRRPFHRQPGLASVPSYG